MIIYTWAANNKKFPELFDQSYSTTTKWTITYIDQLIDHDALKCPCPQQGVHYYRLSTNRCEYEQEVMSAQTSSGNHLNVMTQKNNSLVIEIM